jgi:hypothetical protein
MARRAIAVTIRRPGFEATETFSSAADALAWREMVEATLDHRDKARYDLTAYAQGLADTVRTHGGAYTKAKWLDVEVPQEQWIKGMPVTLEDEDMIRDVLVGRSLKPAQKDGRGD